MLIGFGLNHNSNLYLLCGIPLTVGFQLVIRKQPLRALWVRDAPALAWTLRFGRLVIIFAIPGIAYLVGYSLQGRASDAGTAAASALGAVGLAYAVVNAKRTTAREVVGCLATTGSIGVVIFLQIAYTHGFGSAGILDRLGRGLGGLAFMATVVFMLEEVAFRGAVDSHVHHLGESRGLFSTLAVALMWGAWHIPLDPHPGLFYGPWGLDGVAGNLLYQGIIGVPYSLWWRRSGNLVVTGVTHAATDAFRNAILV